MMGDRLPVTETRGGETPGEWVVAPAPAVQTVSDEAAWAVGQDGDGHDDTSEGASE
jgi:hypothetical protein